MKKETLEEAAEKLILEYELGKTGKIDIEDAKEMLIEFAKWQQERMYSEEDMAESFMACWKANVPEGFECKLSFKEWFKKFKKK